MVHCSEEMNEIVSSVHSMRMNCVIDQIKKTKYYFDNISIVGIDHDEKKEIFSHFTRPLIGRLTQLFIDST